MEARTYIAFYKPYGVLTAFTDEEGRETLKAFIDIPDVYSVGRLDMDSEGLLLLTDDGGLAHRLTDPRYNHPKTYLVQVEGTPTPEAIGKLESGVEIKGVRTRRTQVVVIPEPTVPERVNPTGQAKPVTPHGPTAWLRIVLREGKKRQIRHMTAAVGLPTLRIVRVAVGPIGVGELKPGEWRHLTEAEVQMLKALASTPAERQQKEPKPKKKLYTPEPPRLKQRRRNPTEGKGPSGKGPKRPVRRRGTL